MLWAKLNCEVRYEKAVNAILALTKIARAAISYDRWWRIYYFCFSYGYI